MSSTSEVRLEGADGVETRRTLLAAVDGSPTSLRALAYALGLASREDAGLVVVHVAEPPPPYLVVGTEVDRWQDDQRTVVRAVRDAMRLSEDCRVVTVDGQPFPEIVCIARAVRADLIVVGASERRTHLVSGSVTGRLVRAAVCPVVVVP